MCPGTAVWSLVKICVCSESVIVRSLVDGISLRDIVRKIYRLGASLRGLPKPDSRDGFTRLGHLLRYYHSKFDRIDPRSFIYSARCLHSYVEPPSTFPPTIFFNSLNSSSCSSVYSSHSGNISIVRTTAHRGAVIDWLPQVERQPEVKSRRGWEKTSGL